MQQVGLKQWTRETVWRKGHVLTPQAAAHFGLTNAVDAASTCVVLISHDCDLANDNLDVEPYVELVVGRTVEKPNGSFTWAKAPRTLHYESERQGQSVHIELVATCKQHVRKTDLAQFKPDFAHVLSGKMLAVLRSWLASRYHRAAFPDAFVERMKQTKVDEKLAKVLDARGKDISFIYFNLDKGQLVERTQGDPYRLAIVLVFAVGQDPAAAEFAAHEIAAEVEKVVRARLPEGGLIVLDACFAISEEEITVSQARLLTQWRLEHMTLRTG